jgi:hypothetical protein
MSESRVAKRGETVVASVLRPMNDHGTVTVEITDRHSTRHVVEYETPAVERTLSAMPKGATLRLVMTPIESRANVWRVAAPTGRYEGGGSASERGTPASETGHSATSDDEN